LTQEEARMATAQILKVTHTVDEHVRGVRDKVLGVDNRVARVDDSVARVDVRVARVDDRVAHIDDRVAGVDDRVDQVKRMSSPNHIDTCNVAQPSSQRINYDRIFVDGSPHRIPPRIIT
jgi:hypothetical protein